MEQKSSYILVGIFVFIFFFCMIGSILWLHGNSDKTIYKYYKINTSDSVSGLGKKASVTFNGLGVGEVVDLSINENDVFQITITIKVSENTPITQDTYAVIESRGITGLSFIQLSGGSKNSLPLKTSNDPKEYGVIKSSPSMLSRVDEGLSSILESSKITIEKIGKIASDDNIKNIELILSNIANITNTLSSTTTLIEERIDKFDTVLQKAIVFENSAIKAADNLSQMSTSLKIAIENINEKIKLGEFDFKSVIDKNLAPIQTSAIEFEMLLRQLRQNLESLSASPSDLFFRAGRVEAGPGE